MTDVDKAFMCLLNHFKKLTFCLIFHYFKINTGSGEMLTDIIVQFPADLASLSFLAINSCLHQLFLFLLILVFYFLLQLAFFSDVSERANNMLYLFVFFKNRLRIYFQPYPFSGIISLNPHYLISHYAPCAHGSRNWIFFLCQWVSIVIK